MKVTFQLLRQNEHAETGALLVLGDQASAVVAACARLAIDPLPLVFRVAGGFLLKLPRPLAAGPVPRMEAVAGAIRLRSLADKLYLPTDAELSPGLLADEARALVRERGLVFLPGGQVLAFDVKQPVPLHRLLEAGEVRRDAWEAFPEPRRRAERIHSITLEMPEEPELIIEAGGADIGSDLPRPPASSLPMKMLGQATMGAGKTLFHLGNLLGLKGLASVGAGWMNKAMDMVPRLSESVLGQQEAALRELLRLFRLGNLEDALRRALPLGDGGGRGGTPYTGQNLPTHSLLYSLSSLLGGRGGPVSIWYGGADVQAELSKEYRRAAEEAIRKGDFRRAAFIYGKLLSDYRMAANVLMQGCLFHDAAVLYLSKVNDRRAAARAFEAAGEVDRALELYRLLEEHVLAGDLFRRIGEEELAFAEYQQAAERMAKAGNHLGAGDLMLMKAESPEHAREYFQLGWNHRPDGTAIPCGLRLARIHGEARAFPRLLALVGEARAHFARPGDEVGAEQFFNELATLAERPSLAEVRDELRDHALMGLALKLRQRSATESRPGNAVSTLFARSGTWSHAAVSDADYAYLKEVRQPEKILAPASANRVRLGVGRVTAVCHAKVSGDVFVGFLSGDVVCFRPTTGEVVTVKSGDGMHVTSLSCTPHASFLCVLQTNGHVRLRCYARGPDGAYKLIERTEEHFQAASGPSWLTPEILGSDFNYGSMIGGDFSVRQVISNRRERPNPHFQGLMNSMLLLQIAWQDELHLLLMFIFGEDALIYRALHRDERRLVVTLGWCPAPRSGSALTTAPLAHLVHSTDVELAGLDREGVLNWSRLHIRPRESVESVARSTASRPGGFLATTIVRPSFLAGVLADRVEWLRAGAPYLSIHSKTAVDAPKAVACVASTGTNELLIVCQDGFLVRIPIPFG